VALEATTKADAQTPELALTEVATVLSLVADGPLKVAGLLSPEAIGPVADAYMTVLADMRAPVAGALVQQPASANVIIGVPATDKQRSAFEGMLETVVSNAGRSQALNDATFALLKAVAAAPHAKQFAAFSVQTADAIKFVRFLGTSFKAGIGGEGGTLQVASVRTGRMVDAAKANAEAFKTLVRKNKKQQANAVMLKFLDFGTAFRSQMFMGASSPAVLMPVERMEANATVDFKFLPRNEENMPELGEDGYSIEPDSLTDVEGTNYFRLHLDGRGQPAQISLISLEAFSDFLDLPGEEDFTVQSLAPEMIGPLPLSRISQLSQVGELGMMLSSAPPGITMQGFRFNLPVAEHQVPWLMILAANSAGEVVGFYLIPEFFVTQQTPEWLEEPGEDEMSIIQQMVIYFSVAQRIDLWSGLIN
jgi:hypothetical protein